VDDQRDVIELIAIAIEERGMEAVKAHGGRAAIQQLCEACVEGKPFDVMILDIHMPDIDGWEVLSAVKANPLWRHMPVIAVTGQANGASDVTRLSNQGALYVDKATDFVNFMPKMVERILQAGAPVAAL